MNQVGFYAQRLKQEEFTRRMGLIFAVLALLLNLNLSLFAPEASVLASPGNDVVTGGIYGANAQQMQDRAINAMRTAPHTAAIFNFYGITEQDIRNTTLGTLSTADQSLRSVGRQSFGRGAEVCYTHQGQSFCERSMYAAYSYRSLNVRALTGARADRIGSSDPWFAIVESCGNVVIRVGKGEDITLNKVLPSDQKRSVQPGQLVDFRLKLKSHNNNGAFAPRITDTIPQNTSYVNHFPKDVFDDVKVSGRTVELINTQPANGVGPNQQVTVTLRLRVANNAPDGAELCNQARATSLADSAVSTSQPCVTVNVPEPEPVCENLRMLGSGGTNKVRTFEARANSDGAKIQNYTFTFGDGEKKTVSTGAEKASVTHTYEPGTYKASVVVKTSEGNVGGSGSCVVNLKVNAPAPSPAVTCDYIKLISGSGTDLTRTFEVSATPENGASVSAFVVTFGDGLEQTVTTNPSNKVEVSHTYDEAGSYTVRTLAQTSLGEVTNNSSCKLAVNIEPEPEVCPYNSELPAASEECVRPEVCPYNPALQPDDPRCGIADIFRLKTVSNITQEIADAHGTTANAGDTIRFTLLTENDGTAIAESYVIKDDLADVLQYADIIDLSGGVLSRDGLVVTWPKIDLEPGESVEKTITVKVKTPIPDTPVSASDPLAFDLMMENAYGNNVTVKLPESIPKRVEGVVSTLPKTGPGLNATVTTFFMGVVTYFYFRNRLIQKELKMIRNEFSGGMLQ